MGWFGGELNKETTVLTTSWADCTQRKVLAYCLILMKEEGHQLSALGLDGAWRGIHCNNLEGDGHVSRVTYKSDDWWSRNTAQVTCIEGSWGEYMPWPHSPPTPSLLPGLHIGRIQSNWKPEGRRFCDAYGSVSRSTEHDGEGCRA